MRFGKALAAVCVSAAAAFGGAFAAKAAAETSADEKMQVNGEEETKWVNVVDYEEATYSSYTAFGSAAVDSGKNFMFNADHDVIVSENIGTVGSSEALTWYFNMSGCGMGAGYVPEIGFALVSGEAAANVHKTAGSAGVVVGSQRSYLWKNGATDSAATFDGAERTTAIFETGSWGSNIQINVIFAPGAKEIVVQTLKTENGGGFVEQIRIENVEMASENVRLAMFVYDDVQEGANFTQANWAVPTITKGRYTAGGEHGTEYTGIISGSDGGYIVTKNAADLGALGRYVLEFDVSGEGSTSDWIGFAVGRTSSPSSGPLFAKRADSVAFYYGASGGGTCVADVNLDVIGWEAHSLPFASVFATGRHIKVTYSLGEGTYRLVSSMQGTEDIVHANLSKLNFSSTDNVYMAIIFSGTGSLKVSGLQFYTVTEKAEWIVYDRIEALGEVTLGSKAETESIRAAYEALDEAQKAVVTNYAKLVAAEQTIAELEREIGEKTAPVEALIEEIGTVDDSDGCADRIEAARSAYEALTETEKEYVGNYQLLTAAEEAYAAAAARRTEEVEKKIDGIGRVELTEECKARIDDARTAYDGLRETLKGNVGNYGALTAAEEAYAALANAESVERAKAAIAAIGTVEYTDECRERIEAARSACDGLDESLLSEVDNYEALTTAERDYALLKAAADREAASVAEEKIAAIGTAENTEESRAKVAAAREAYDNLTETQKALVSNYEALTEAEEALKAFDTPAPPDSSGKGESASGSSSGTESAESGCGSALGGFGFAWLAAGAAVAVLKRKRG